MSFGFGASAPPGVSASIGLIHNQDLCALFVAVVFSCIVSLRPLVKAGLSLTMEQLSIYLQKRLHFIVKISTNVHPQHEPTPTLSNAHHQRIMLDVEYENVKNHISSNPNEYVLLWILAAGCLVEFKTLCDILPSSLHAIDFTTRSASMKKISVCCRPC